MKRVKDGTCPKCGEDSFVAKRTKPRGRRLPLVGARPITPGRRPSGRSRGGIWHAIGARVVSHACTP